MKPSVPTISPLLRSDLQGRLLAELLIAPEEHTLSGLTKAVDATMPTVHRELDRLVSSGFLSERRSGRNRYVQANVDHPLYRPVRQIVEYAYGPRLVLSRLLSLVDGIEEAYIYGSWAARMNGEEGADPADIDVLVVGRPDRADMFDAAAAAQREIGREVNIRSIRADRWKAADEPFLRSVRQRPLVQLELAARKAEV
ncbi:ArsR family transcriptional regulator [Microbacterium sp. Gd 4-13]|nr:ArsR family transcriptional regulator [Microbacterium sp. Gd 4-13]